ncbi:hypothetical protein ISN45_Aa05g015610 [Arabidopsis thaliana x Arabidopsis arenosa]|uniref:Uncharacterized protein n=1 Tax=Arabidopsis thaliana x Arabidopsis arenosa TaxID=1240361 RepID=A0A8T1ZKL5_9BRAS|nr:hypothetical protein ISN45_Aa05g015610 [Arabidopsis thaliana x Arabidopsis arenosa]
MSCARLLAGFLSSKVFSWLLGACGPVTADFILWGVVRSRLIWVKASASSSSAIGSYSIWGAMNQFISSSSWELRMSCAFKLNIFLSSLDFERVMGPSRTSGGDVVLLYASKYHDIPNVINLSGRYDLKKGIGERLGDDFLERIKDQGYIDVKDGDSGYRVTEESLMDRLNTDMHEACLKIDKECR